MSDDDETFETVDAGSSHTFPTSAGDLKKGDFVCIKGFPCRIVDVSTSKTGKHGHAKANITAIDIFTNKKYEEVSPTSHALPCPFVKKVEYMLMDIANGRYSLLDEDNKDVDFPAPSDAELAGKIQEAADAGKEVTIIITSAMGVDQILDFKVKGAA